MGQKYFELIDQSDLSEDEKHNARIALEEAIQEVHRGEIAGLRMKIRGYPRRKHLADKMADVRIQIEKKWFHTYSVTRQQTQTGCARAFRRVN